MLQPNIYKFLRNRANQLLGYDRWLEYNDDCLTTVSLQLMHKLAKEKKLSYDICDYILDKHIGYTRYWRERIKSRRKRFIHLTEDKLKYIIETWNPNKCAFKSPEVIQWEKDQAAELKKQLAAKIQKEYTEWVKTYKGTW